MFKNLKLKSIRIKILVPILTVVFIGMSVFGLLTYNSEKKSLTNMMDEITTLKVQETKGLISERESNVNVLKQSLNKYLISITQAIAEELKYTPEDKLNSETERLAKAVGVAEIHVTDGKGVLRWGTVPSFYGFDFSTSDQTKPFLPGLTDKNFALAQEPEPRGTDKQLFQYITVTRKDTTGLVQIGVAPKELEELLDKVNVNNLAKSTKLGKAGYIFILDKEGKMISHPKDSEIGKTLKDYDWGSKIQSSNKGSFTYFYEGIEKYLAFEKTDSYIIAASIPTSEYYDKLKELRNLAVIFTVTAMLLLSIIITIISNKFLINRIKNILNKVSQVGEGNLKVDIKDKSSDELGQLSSGLNNMILNLRNLVSNINWSAIKLNQTADTVAVASDQTSAAALEIANSVNEIAKGTSSQAEEVQNSVNMLEQVTEDIREITSSTKIITEKVSEIDKKNRHSIESINDLKNKFADNKKATKSVNDSIIMLSERSNKIGVITESISAISSQTNLLALNASIEAARAGESGKGFAVVADEVRKLAEQSADAANSIDTLIREIKGDIDHAVKSIDIAGKSVEESDSRLNNTVNNFYSLKESNDSMINLVKKLDEISILLNANTDKVVVAVNSIASVSEESAATTEEISAAAEEQTATFEGIKESTIELRSLSNQLIEIVKSFKIEE